MLNCDADSDVATGWESAVMAVYGWSRIVGVS